MGLVARERVNKTGVMFSSANHRPTSQPVPSDRSFIFTNSSRRDHTKTRPAKLVVLAAVSLPNNTNPVKKYQRLSSKKASPSTPEKSVNWVDESKSLEFAENPCGLQANEFMGVIKTLASKERIGIFNSSGKDSRRRNWTISEFNDLLMSLVTENEQEIALKLYNDISSYGLAPDCWTFSIMVRCYCKKNDLVEAGQVLDYMIDNGLCPNVTTFTVVIDSLCKNGRLQRAIEVFEVMGRVGCEPSIQTYNCLLKGLCYVGRVEEAFDMLVDIKKNEARKPDIYTYTAVMDGFCKVGRSNEAMELLNEAVKGGLTPSVVTFNTLFNGYCKDGKPMKGFRVLRLMKERNCMPDCISYSTLLYGLLRWGETRAAVRVFKEMVGFGFEVEERMLQTLLRALCIKSWKEKDLLEDAYQVFEKLKDNISAMDTGTYGMVIRALCMGKRTEEALVHLAYMITTGDIPRTITFNNMIQALSGEGKVYEALSVVIMMCERGKIPSKTTYDVLIKKLNQLARYSVACIVYGAALKQGVVPHRKPLDGDKVVRQLKQCLSD